MAAWLDPFHLRVPFTSRPLEAVFPTPFSGLHVWPSSSIRWVDLPHCVPPSLPLGGSGILTGCPSPTPAGLGLGPTNPTWIDLPSEPLGFRQIRFSRIQRYSYQHSHFPVLHRSFRYGFFAQGTLPYQSLPRPHGFGRKLEPRYIFRAGPLDQ